MKKKWNWKKVSAVCAGAMLALSFAFGLVFSNLSLNEENFDSASNINENVEGGGTDSKDNLIPNYVASNNTLIADSASGLNLYSTGDTFWYTDYTAGVKLGNGDTSVSTDRVIVTVNNLSTNKGTLQNPYVINSKDDWNAFVTYVGKSGNNYGVNKVFVLNCDLDYKTTAGERGNIMTLYRFDGWFLGNGHTISNITLQKANNDEAHLLGLFNNVIIGSNSSINGVLADLTLYNVSNSNYPAAGFAGALVGHSRASSGKTLFITNIIVKAEFTFTNPLCTGESSCGLNPWRGLGGMMGVFHGVNGTLNVYKCAGDVKMTINDGSTNLWIAIGGLIGHVDGTYNGGTPNTCFGEAYASTATVTPIAAFNLYDSYSKLDFTYNRNAATFSGLWSGIVGYFRTIKSCTIKRCLAIQNAVTPQTTENSTASSDRYSVGIIGVPGENRIANVANNYLFEDIYGYGNHKWGNANYAIPLIGIYYCQNQGTANATVKNCKIYSDNGKTYKHNMGNSGGLTTNNVNATYFSNGSSGFASANTNTPANLDAFKSATTGALNNPAIWSTGAINSITSPTSTPDIVANPIVVNKTRISFVNVDNSALTFTDGGAAVREYAISEAGIKDLPRPTAVEGKSFVGWTLDKTSDKTTYTKFPANLYGNVTMYPVYDMTEVAVTVTPSGDGIAGDTTDTSFTKEYTGTPVITLTASVTLPAGCTSENSVITWSWYKNEGGTETKLSETSNELALQERTNATYYAKVKVVHNSKLWRTASDVKSAKEFTIEIGKGNLTPAGVTGIDPAQKAYWGQELNDTDNPLRIVPHMRNAGGIEVAGTAVWKDGATKVGDSTATYTAVFTPTDTANYESREIQVTVEPTVLKLVFEIDKSKLSDARFEYEVEYKSTFTGAELIQKFNEAYFAYLDIEGNAGKVGNNMPQFEGDFVDAYLENNGTQTKASFIKSEIDKMTDGVLTVPVGFAVPTNAPYQAIFHTGEASYTESTRNLYYGQKVPRPTTTELPGTTYKFLQGWYIADAAGNLIDADGNAAGEDETKWVPYNFETAHITGTVHIAAKWIEGTRTLSSITAELARNITELTAMTTPSVHEYKVTGHYTVRAGDTTRNVDIVLAPTEYTVRAAGGSTYNVNNKSVTITSTADNSKTCPVDNLPIVAMALRITNMTFPDGETTVQTGVNQKINSAYIEFDVTGLRQGTDYDTYYTYYRNGVQMARLLNNEGSDGVSEIGMYFVEVEFDFSKNPNYRCNTKLTANFEIKDEAKLLDIKWDTTGAEEVDGKWVYEFNGQVQHPTVTFYLTGTTTKVSLYEDITFEYTGHKSSTGASTSYKVGVRLKTIVYEINTDPLAGNELEIEYSIKKAQVAVPNLGQSSFTYKKGVTADISNELNYTPEERQYLVELRNASAENVPFGGAPIVTTISLRDKNNSEWEDGSGTGDKTVSWHLLPQSVAVPTFRENSLTYNSVTYSIQDYLVGFDAEAMIIDDTSEYEAKDAGGYRVLVGLQHETNYVWADPDFNGQIYWTIAPKKLSLGWDSWNFAQDPSRPNQIFSPRVTRVSGIADGDRNLTLTCADAFVYSGDVNANVAGSYKVVADVTTVDNTYAWLRKNYVINDSTKTLYWVIRSNASEVIIKLIWDMQDNGYYMYNGEVQRPSVIGIYDERDMPLDLNGYLVDYEGTFDQWAGDYTVKATVSSKDAPETQYRIVQETLSYRILKNGDQGGRPGTDPNPKPNPDENGGGDNPSPETIGAIPQLIISGVSLVLILVFGIMTMNYASAAKRAKAKVKKLAQMSYSFAPVGLLAPALLGISDSNWWIIAGVLMGLALFTAILMFIYRGKSRRALAMLEEEQERIEEEKELAREAERDRRDNELKMMFAAMQQQNYQQQPVGYDDMQNMIASAVTALLPGLQQSMQALPPAQSQPETSEADELRAQMAQQQEMINQLLQNQQAQQQSYAAPAQAYAEPEPPVFTDDETISLEELYGKMSDDAKRLYYEIGGYIMGKPDTAQNDGKYSVLFKHRGKTLFKLCIKNDAPVLYYALDNGTQGEAIISDLSTLEMAKGIVDLRISQSDR